MLPKTIWNPRLYNKFKAEHFASFGDLLQLVTKKPDLKVVDLGCGTGELTRKLADSLPNSDVLGIDTSPEMLQEAQAFTKSQLRFEQMFMEELVEQKSKWDLVFSHTALQWVEDHQAFFPKLIASVARGGQLVTEMVLPDAYPHKKALDDLARSDPFRTALRGWTWSIPVLSSEAYATILFKNGGSNITAFEKVYPVVLRDVDTLFDFSAGTIMVAYMSRLPQEEQLSFSEAYKKILQEKFPEKPVLLTYKRVFLAATF